MKKLIIPIFAIFLISFACAKTIAPVCDLSNYRTLDNNEFSSINTSSVDASSYGVLQFKIYPAENFIIDRNAVYFMSHYYKDLGTSSYKFKDGYFSGNLYSSSIHTGDVYVDFLHVSTGITASGTDCKITEIKDGIITGATCV